jgi:hypothetical protein
MPGTSGRQDQFSKQSKVGSKLPSPGLLKRMFQPRRKHIPLAVSPNEDRASAQVLMLGGEPASERLSYV